MRKISILTILICILLACNQNRHTGSLSGTLKNIKDGTVLLLVDIESGTVFQRIPVNNGQFKTSFNLSEPRFFGMWGESPKYDKDRIFLWLENSKIKVNGKYDYLVNAKIEGSFSNKIYDQYNTIEKTYEHKLTGLHQTTIMTNNKLVRDSIQKVTDELVKQYKIDLIKFYSDHIQNNVALYFLVSEITKYKSVLLKSDIEKLYNDLPEKFKFSKEGTLLKDYVSLPEMPKIGEKFIDFSQTTPDGKNESISNHLGKYTILEFWASGCAPCRGEHPKMRELYSLYHDKGLNIIGISGDDNSKYWNDAIITDSIPWLNISDLQGWHNKAFMIYGVKAIPLLLLLDEKGIIIDNEFGQKDIESELQRRFN